MSIIQGKYKNNIGIQEGTKNKYRKEFCKMEKGKYYVEELEPLLGAVVNIECEDWVFIPGTLRGESCEKLLLKSSKLVKSPTGRNIKCPMKISRKIWMAVDSDLRERIELEEKNNSKFIGVHGHTPIICRGRVYEYKVFINGKKGKCVKKNIGFQCLSVWKKSER